MKPILSFKRENRTKDCFFASDYGRLEAELILQFLKTPATNPPEWNNSLKWQAGKAVEEQMIKVLKENGFVDSTYEQDNFPTTIMQREGIEIHMKFDARVKAGVLNCEDSRLPQNTTVYLNEGEPLEIKSINNANSFDVQNYVIGKPRDNYVGQLAIYMDALNMERGHLFVSTIDGLQVFWFVCEKVGEGKYRCGDTEVDVYKEYKRWANIWRKFKGGEDPNWHEEEYKLPLEKIEWLSLSKNAIQEARMNRKVVGSAGAYKILYSPFRDLIILKQGHKSRGYSDAELEKIRVATAGYSSKKLKTNE